MAKEIVENPLKTINLVLVKISQLQTHLSM